ncbi:TPA: hypothetical protein CPU00_05345 [Candidatus Gastranaerophilales bacterium HUM_18]|jgi:flagellin-like hook-associated protein FlgL|nr:MAG TPA: hypothetical protein CPU00_05345 [Candidatus Gastranaerophilales bacterium HUM_18]
MQSVNTNLSSLIIQTNLKSSTKCLNIAIERMSTGFKINHAKDNVANFSISTKLSSQISAYEVAEDNAIAGLEMLTTATEKLDIISEHLTRIRELAELAQNGTYGKASIDAINAEIKAHGTEINRILKSAKYEDEIFTEKFHETRGGFINKVTKRDTSTMTTLASVNENTSISSGTYSISTAEELAKLATMTNSNKIGAGAEFVLANDIDLSVYSDGEGWIPIGAKYASFKGKFDGNGYVVSNLYINNPTKERQGLFGTIVGNVIKNIGIEDVSITGADAVAGIAGYSGEGTIIDNCYVKNGDILATNQRAGGVAGCNLKGVLKNCYTDVNVMSRAIAGGLVGTYSYSYVENCEVYGNVEGGAAVGGLIGLVDFSNQPDGYIKNCILYNNEFGYLDGIFIGGKWWDNRVINYNKYIIENCSYNSKISDLNLIGWEHDYEVEIKNVTQIECKSTPLTSFQIGINGESTDQISCQMKFDIAGLAFLSGTSNKSLYKIDYYLNKISEKQTEFGAMENRLESVLEEISIKYENLVSTQSTIRDTDIAEESSAYIRNQILQQASATLLATANQTPSITLQLL